MQGNFFDNPRDFFHFHLVGDKVFGRLVFDVGDGVRVSRDTCDRVNADNESLRKRAAEFCGERAQGEDKAFVALTVLPLVILHGVCHIDYHNHIETRAVADEGICNRNKDKFCKPFRRFRRAGGDCKGKNQH